VALAELEELPKLGPVESYDHLAVNDRDGRRPHPELQEFLQGLSVFPDVLFDKLHTLLRKKLSLLVTRPSTGLAIDDHLFRHDPSLVW